MSKISQELKALLYLNQRHARTSFVNIREIAEYLEVSDRQARRYMEDLSLIPEIDIVTKLGRDGGYRLQTPLDKGFAMPENIVLAMSIAMRQNKRIEEVLARIPNYVITDRIVGDNQIDNEVLDHLEVIVEAIANQKELGLYYKDFENIYVVQPYRVALTNHTYYLYFVNNDKIKKLDVRLIQRITTLSSFKPKKEILAQIDNRLSHYGIKDGKETVLRVRCKDIDALKTFDRYFEGRGTMDEDNLIYEVVGNSENELYYPLFRISTKDYVFLDGKFKENYLRYLEHQIKSIERRKTDAKTRSI